MTRTGDDTRTRTGTVVVSRARCSDSSLSVGTQRYDDAVLIRARGALCAATASTLHESVLSALTGSPDRLVLDLGGLSAGTGAGESVLHAVADHARLRGVVPIVRVPSPRLRTRLAELAACGLRIVQSLPALGTPSEPGESPRTTSPTGASVAAWGIGELLGRYGTALVRGDALFASRCHTEPTFVTEASTVLTIPTHAEVEGSLAQLAGTYRAAGLVSARHAVETVTLLDEQYCEVTVLWCHSGVDERSRVHARYRYLLRRVPSGPACGRTLINTVTLIDGPRVAAPPEG